jgi:acid phosphatase type 7
MTRDAVRLCALLLLTPALAAWGQTPPVLAVAGDIACDPADVNFNAGNGTATACRMKATSDLALAFDPDAVLLLGDNQYENGALAKYQASYDPTWGRLKAVTYPIPGNHEYVTAGAAGYYTYFGAAAHNPAKGYYSFDLGGWHLLALNSNCAEIGGCGPGSPQEQWLAADLAAHPGVCTLAYWHHPRFSSGPHGNDPISQTFWTDLYNAGADLVLNGHDHVYERFAPQDPASTFDPLRGLRQITIGTGGKNLTSFPVVRANSQVRNASAYGILKLTLYPKGYTWQFVTDGGAVADSGAGLCHSALPSEATSFYTIAPCRVADTRQIGPALTGGSTRSFPVAGTCGIPADAVAVAANVTAVNPSAGGHFQLRPTGGAALGTSAVSFAAGRARADNVVLALGVQGEVDVICNLAQAGTAHFVLDVSGYFR